MSYSKNPNRPSQAWSLSDEGNMWIQAAAETTCQEVTAGCWHTSSTCCKGRARISTATIQCHQLSSNLTGSRRDQTESCEKHGRKRSVRNKKGPWRSQATVSSPGEWTRELGSEPLSQLEQRTLLGPASETEPPVADKQSIILQALGQWPGELCAFIARYSYAPFDGPSEQPELELPQTTGQSVCLWTGGWRRLVCGRAGRRHKRIHPL